MRRARSVANVIQRNRAQFERKIEIRALSMLATAVPVSAWAHPAAAAANDVMIYTLSALLLGLGVFTAILWRRNVAYREAKHDIERQHAEVTHAARLALIGEITASITHEVTQPLSAILNNVETAEVLLRRSNPDLPLVLEILGDIRSDEIRAYDIVRKLRLLLQKREVQMEEVDLNSLVKSVMALIRADAARRQVAISARLDSRVPHVRADPVHLQQVLLNLILNGMDAMEETPIGERCLDIQTVFAERHIEVLVIDHGKGIDPANFSRLFKPFFTTKPTGMGVGLSITRSIIAMHGGSIQAENGRAQNGGPGGAVFRFTLPVCVPKSVQQRFSANAAKPGMPT
jgi:C4-dicarboxylate-specific signal transduction histidine kinase